MKFHSEGAGDPLSFLYFTGLKLDRFLTKAKKLSRPVVSVGNIAVGGRAKTPFVIEICRGLLEKGFKPVVLTRGYGRKSRHPHQVDISNNPQSWNLTQAGDEALEIAYFAQVPVVVGANRYQNARNYLKEHSDLENIVFVLDDGFQHWKLKRDFDLVLVAEEDFKAKLLPWGRLREPVASLSRAHLVFEQGKDFRKITEFSYSQPISGEIFFLSTRAPSPAYALELKKIFPQITGLVLPDHAGLAQIESAIRSSLAEILVLGAKEAVKIFSLDDFDLFVKTGQLKKKYLGKERHFLFAKCRLEIQSLELFWGPLMRSLKAMP